MSIGPCGEKDFGDICAIINQAAEAYRGVIPADRFHEPYMSARHLADEIARGVAFWGYRDEHGLAGVMGIQDVKDVTLIRHAYVLPARQRSGIGSALLETLIARSERPLLVGTWRAARWAIAFYQRHGFTRLDDEETPVVLRRYWSIPDRQVEESVVLAHAGG